ncbi:sugar nucleotide-binding protein, partial [bacterium]|nr:sugar nucleotide-binding protein [bacterium]
MSDRGATLVVGGDSVIGKALVEKLRLAGETVLATTRRHEIVSESRPYLDLSTNDTRWQPAVPISKAFLCAATTSLKACELEPKKSRRTNVDHTVAVTRQLSQTGAFVVFISSNLVYDGARPYREANEPTCPTVEYGKQKAAAEEQLLQLDRLAVVRCTKVLQSPFPLF